MDVPEEKYRKTLSLFREPLTNLLSEYPLGEKETPQIRNLKYILQKESVSLNLPYDDDHYINVFQDIKHHVASEKAESRLYAVRLARALPFYYRVKVVEELQNELIKLVTVSGGNNDSPSKAQNKQKSIQLKQSGSQFYYQMMADEVDLLLSVYELSHLSEEIYFDVNQRILTIIGRIVETGFDSEKKQLLRNVYECLRSIFLMFGPKKLEDDNQYQIKLINKLINFFSPNTAFLGKGGNLSNLSNFHYMSQKSYGSKFYHLILKTREFQVRNRSRYMYGLCCLLTYGQFPSQVVDLLARQIFNILENANQCDVNIDCFNAIKALLRDKLQFHTRQNVLKKWAGIMLEVPYKKEYLQYFLALMEQVSTFQQPTPIKLKFKVGISLLEITKNIQQQLSRFILYKLICRSIMEVSRVLSTKGQSSMVLLNIFQYSWFLDRVKQENDLFRSQFLICLLQSFFVGSQRSSKQEIKDLLSLCHVLLDWKCSSKEDTHIPTIKFAFDMYLGFLKEACERLGEQVQSVILELIEKCNDAQNIYFLFKLKLISTLVSLPWYQKNNKFLAEVKLNFTYLQEEIRISIMPKNPKPIFDFAYSQSEDGLVESRKEIEFVKVIMDLLSNLQKSHQEMNEMVERILIEYHAFLNELEMVPTANKDLIYCLQTGTADQYFSTAQRHFLLSLIDQTDCKGNNFELNLDGNILYSPYESFETEDEINIFGPMSPVQLTVKLHLHNSYSSLYLQIKKSNWVSTPKLKLVISSGMEKKQMVFESSIVQMKVDRVGSLHFQVWTAEGNELLIGSGNIKIKRKLQWRKVNYLGFVDGIKRKSYFKKVDNAAPQPECFLSYYYGEPLLVQIFRSQNEVVFGVCNKEVWNELQSSLSDIIQEFTDNSAIIFQ